jgi:hypothetical protein
MSADCSGTGRFCGSARKEGGGRLQQQSERRVKTVRHAAVVCVPLRESDRSPFCLFQCFCGDVSLVLSAATSVKNVSHSAKQTRVKTLLQCSASLVEVLCLGHGRRQLQLSHAAC